MEYPLPLIHRPGFGRTCLVASAILFGLGCGSGGGGGQGTPVAPPVPPPPPGPEALAIEKVEPPQAAPGDLITLVGPGLGKAFSVWFEGPAPGAFERVDDRTLKVTVPERARTGPIDVFAVGTAKSKEAFKVLPAKAPRPILERIDPAVGSPGRLAVLRGKGLEGADQVTFGQVPARISTCLDTAVFVVIPDQAKAGDVTIRTPGGEGRIRDYPIRSAGTLVPEILNLVPKAGPAGTVVTIYGTDLGGITQVAFAGSPARLEDVTSGWISARVPPGAHTGPVTLEQGPGQSYEAGTFSVTAGGVAPARITAFTPESGPPGTRVVLEGPGVGSLGRVSLGGLTCWHFIHNADRVITYLPEAHQNPRSAPLELTLADGQVLRTERPFHIVKGRPVIDSIEPASGPIGTQVRVRGRHLDHPTTVTLGGTKAPAIPYASPTEFLVQVPAGATGGPIRITTPGGEATSEQAFTVASGASALTITIAKLLVTQGIQNPEGNLPLVKGRAGYLRAFVLANAPNHAAPSVRITVRTAAGAEVLNQLIPAPNRAGVPMHLLEEQWDSSWNLGLPAIAFKPGHTIMAELVWDGTPPPLLAGPATFPHDGHPLAMNVHVVPALHLVLRPIRSGGRTGKVTRPGRTLEDWITPLKELLPLAEVDVVEGPPFDTPLELGANMNDYDRVVQALEVARRLEPGMRWSYWYGVFEQPRNGSLNGIAANFGEKGRSEWRSAIGFDGDRRDLGGSFWGDTMRHELSHCMGRYHSPCGGAGSPDEHYPHAGAGLGAAGVKVASGELISPEIYKDIMGYCYPRWISDYTYKGILDFRAGDPLPQAERLAAAHAGPPPNCLLVWGRIHDGRLELEPAFQAPMEPHRPAPGDYRLVLRDGHGSVLQEVPFATTEVPDLPAGDIRNFMMAIPCPPMLAEALAAIEVVRDGRLLGALRAPEAANPLADHRDPVAVPWGPGNVHLGWDHGAHPSVIVRDPGTHRTLSVATGGAVDLATSLPELELLMSDGVRTTVKRVRVRP